MQENYCVINSHSDVTTKYGKIFYKSLKKFRNQQLHQRFFQNIWTIFMVSISSESNYRRWLINVFVLKLPEMSSEQKKLPVLRQNRDLKVIFWLVNSFRTAKIEMQLSQLWSNLNRPCLGSLVLPCYIFSACQIFESGPQKICGSWKVSSQTERNELERSRKSEKLFKK